MTWEIIHRLSAERKCRDRCRDVNYSGGERWRARVYCSAASRAGKPAAPRLSTHIYKTAGNLAIKADVYRQDNEPIRPAVVWIHGGALIMGSRSDISGRVKQYALTRLRIDLDRLSARARNTTPEIIQDHVDAFDWIRAMVRDYSTSIRIELRSSAVPPAVISL